MIQPRITLYTLLHVAIFTRSCNLVIRFTNIIITDIREIDALQKLGLTNKICCMVTTCTVIKTVIHLRG